jgi:non-haem Fe2+, alpha-ketoglutarate-dependent halogenase
MNETFYLSPEEIAKFKAQGYLGPFKVYDKEEMAARTRDIRIKLFDRSRAIYNLSPDSTMANYDRHLDVDLLAEHIRRPEIVHRVASLMGRSIVCWRSEFFPKEPGQEGTDWHQADTFAHSTGKPQIVWPRNERFGGTITAWTALTEATEANGCLRFIPGTHEEMYYDESLGLKYDKDSIGKVVKDGVKRGFFGYDYRSLQKDPSWKPDESKAVSIEMEPGQAVLFWSTLMHASMPNSTKDRYRLGYACRYVPTQVKIYPDTEYVEEFDGKYSLEKYRAIPVLD